MKNTQKLPQEANKRLGKVREALGYGRCEMADLLSYSYQTYAAIERGDKSLFIDKLEPLRKTCANIDYIVNGEGEILNNTRSAYFDTQFSRLNEEHKNFVMSLIRLLIDDEKKAANVSSETSE